MRHDGRSPDELRQINIHTDYTMHAEGSVLVEFGNTRVIAISSRA